MRSGRNQLNQARTALRLAWRDLQKNPRGALLVGALVALPSALIMLLSTVLAGQQPTTAEREAALLGQTEARITVGDPYGSALQQSPTDPNLYWQDSPGGGPIQSSQDETAVEDVRALLPQGARVIEVLHGAVTVTTGQARLSVDAVEGDVWDPALAGPYTLTAGAAPAADDEVLLSPGLAEVLGVGIGDEVSVVDDGTPLTVTGFMTARDDYGQHTLYARPGTLALDPDLWSARWFVVDKPVGWDQVQSLNTHGLVAYSRAVADDPPPAPDFGIHNAPEPALLAAGAVGLLAALLLAGAGFVVTFRRQQRHLALVAATGATRRAVAAQGMARGLWIGLAGGAAGAVVGLLGGLAWTAVQLRWGGPDAIASTWGYHVTWWHAVATVLYGALVGTLSSLVPALTSARLDVVAVLRGSQGPAKVRRWPAVAGVVLVALAAVALVIAQRGYDASLDLPGVEAYSASTRASYWLLAGIALGFGGGVLVVSLVLRVIGRVAGGGAVSLRIATRDAARNAGRTVPVVAAIALVVTIVAGAALTMTRDEQRLAASWTPRAQFGDAIAELYWEDPSGKALATQRAADAVVAEMPQAKVSVIDEWLSNVQDLESATAEPSILVPAESLCPDWYTSGAERRTRREISADPRCNGANGNVGPVVFDVAVGDANTLRALLGAEPSAQAVATLDAGGAVVFMPGLIENGQAVIGLWDLSTGNFPDQPGSVPAQQFAIPAVYEEPPNGMANGGRAVISRELADQIGWPVVPTLILVDAPEPITEAQRATLTDAATRASGAQVWFTVENGPYHTMTPGMFAALLAVTLLFAGGCTAIALGLARADAKRDDFTLASLGASPRIVRAVAAWQGAFIIWISSAIGLGLGVAWVAVESHSSPEAPVPMPWAWVLAAWFVMPAVVGALAWLVTRVPKALHYRLAA